MNRRYYAWRDAKGDYHVIDRTDTTTVSREPMLHDDAVVLCERLNLQAGLLAEAA